MPGATDNAPQFTKGEPISASKLNALSAAASRNLAAPGQFQGGGGVVQRPTGFSGGTTIRTARVTTTITAATGPTTWGSGQAQLCHATTGSPTGSSIDVDNEWPEQFAEDSMVKLDMGYSPPRVLGGTCTALDASTFWGDA